MDRLILLMDLPTLQDPRSFLDYGIRLGRALGFPLKVAAYRLLQHVPAEAPLQNLAEGHVHSRQQKEMESMLSRLRTWLPENRVSPQLELESLGLITQDELMDYVKTLERGWLVCQRQSGWSTFNEWFGTVETRMAVRSRVPVLELPPHHCWRPLQTIHYALKPEDDIVENVRLLSLVGYRLKASINLLFLQGRNETGLNEMSPPNARLSRILENLLGLKPTFQQILGDRCSNELIERLRTQNREEWLAFEKHNQPLLRLLFSNHSYKRLILEANLPLFLF